eukprot:207178_1
MGNDVSINIPGCCMQDAFNKYDYDESQDSDNERLKETARKLLHGHNHDRNNSDEKTKEPHKSRHDTTASFDRGNNASVKSKKDKQIKFTKRKKKKVVPHGLTPLKID